MTAHPVPLDLLMGATRAAAYLAARATELAHLDNLPAGTALRLACERATDGDPLILADVGQTWTLRDDVDPDDAPAARLEVHARLTAPPRVLVCDPDDPAGEIDELLLEVLDLYRLTACRTEPAGRIAKEH